MALTAKQRRDLRPEDIEQGVFGRGPSYPFRIDTTTGRTVESEGIEHIKESVKRILTISTGEIPGLPEFGSKVKDQLFAENTPVNRTALFYNITDALIRFEPRVKDVRVQVRESPTEPTEILIEISFRLAATNEMDKLVFPVQREQSGFISGLYPGTIV